MVENYLDSIRRDYLLEKSNNLWKDFEKFYINKVFLDLFRYISLKNKMLYLDKIVWRICIY